MTPDAVTPGAAPPRQPTARSKWRHRIATALVYAGGVVTGFGLSLVLATSKYTSAQRDEHSASGTAYGLPIAPAGLPAPGPAPVRNVSATGRAPSAPPLEVVLPRISVRSRLVGLRLNLDGSVQVPESYGVAGWYRDGPAPGDAGAAVILGHVDSTTGPGIFFRLRELRRGDVALVRRADGTTARFIVSRVAEYPKSRFPARAVYAGTGRPELRLITCAGDFAHGHYLDNLVVYAALDGSVPAHKPAIKPTVKSAHKPASGPAAKSAPQPSSGPVAKSAHKPSSGPAAGSATQPNLRPAAKSAHGTAARSTRPPPA